MNGKEVEEDHLVNIIVVTRKQKSIVDVVRVVVLLKVQELNVKELLLMLTH